MSRPLHDIDEVHYLVLVLQLYDRKYEYARCIITIYFFLISIRVMLRTPELSATLMARDYGKTAAVDSASFLLLMGSA